MKIYLIRHGMTSENMRGAYLGLHNSCLCEEGKNSLAAIQYEFAYDYLISSPLKRCLETCDILFSKQPIINDNFKEYSFGIFENKTYFELENTVEYQMWITDLENYQIPQGEVFKEFKIRVLDEFFKIINDEKFLGKNIILVTHGGVIRTIIEKYFAMPFFEIEIPYGRGYLFEITNKTERLYKL